MKNNAYEFCSVFIVTPFNACRVTNANCDIFTGITLVPSLDNVHRDSEIVILKKNIVEN